jgi:hypothetical protein
MQQGSEAKSIFTGDAHALHRLRITEAVMAPAAHARTVRVHIPTRTHCTSAHPDMRRQAVVAPMPVQAPDEPRRARRALRHHGPVLVNVVVNRLELAMSPQSESRRTRVLCDRRRRVPEVRRRSTMHGIHSNRQPGNRYRSPEFRSVMREHQIGAVLKTVRRINRHCRFKHAAFRAIVVPHDFESGRVAGLSSGRQHFRIENPCAGDLISPPGHKKSCKSEGYT